MYIQLTEIDKNSIKIIQLTQMKNKYNTYNLNTESEVYQ